MSSTVGKYDRAHLKKNNGTTKHCYKCLAYKPLSAFSKHNSMWDKLSGQCKECHNKYQNHRRNANPEAYKQSWIEHNVRKRGLTLKQKEQMKTDQNFRCAICDRHEIELSKPFCVDHNHITNKIRGLLCNNCNLAIGLLKVDTGVTLLEKAIAYVQKKC